MSNQNITHTGNVSRPGKAKQRSCIKLAWSMKLYQ